MKWHKKVIFIITVGSIAAGVFILFACTRTSAYTVYYPFTGRLFSIDPSTLNQISIQDGSTGEKVSYTESEDLSRLVTTLNNLRYNYWVPMIPVRKGGWTYRILFYSSNGVTSLYFGHDWLQHNMVTYHFNCDLYQYIVK